MGAENIRVCLACGNELSKKKRKYCGPACEIAFWLSITQTCSNCGDTFVAHHKFSLCTKCRNEDQKRQESIKQEEKHIHPADFESYESYSKKYDQRTGSHLSYGKYMAIKEGTIGGTRS